MNKSHLMNYLTSFGLTTIFLIMTAFSVWATVNTQNAASQVSNAGYLDDLYHVAQSAVAMQEASEQKYRLEPGPEPFASYQAAGATLIATLQTVKHVGDAGDRALVRQVLALHKRYVLVTTRLMFTAVDKGLAFHARIIDQTIVGPIFSVIQQRITTAAVSQQMEANQRMITLAATEHMIFLLTLIVFPFGLLLLTICLFLLHTYQSKIARTMSTELDRLTRAALIDNLTNLGNHRAYQEDLRRELKNANHKRETLALALIDIDDLKLINNVSGHMQGDHVLITFAAILRQAHLSNALYRLNGDEFAVILPQSCLLDAVTAMEQLRQEAEHSLFGATVSIGIACMPPDDCDSEVLQEQAHMAISEAKQRGHNIVVTFEDIRESVSLIVPAKVQALHRLLRAEPVNVAFQPIWDLEQDRILSFEALARPPVDYGFNGPQEAFDIAEKIGRAHELDYLCVHSILERAAELPSDALLFLNLTPQTLEHDVLTGAVLLEAVLSAGLTPDRVVLEITERSVVRLNVVVREAKKLQALGFRLALDDTGAGNAGLEMLSKLPVDFVKIDRAIVVKALTDVTARAILTGITAMARQMNSYVIAEGIEDIEMLNLVQEVGAQAVQGYLVGRPSQVVPNAQELQALSPAAKRVTSGHVAPVF